MGFHVEAQRILTPNAETSGRRSTGNDRPVLMRQVKTPLEKIMATVKLYDCAECGITMMVEVFADEATTLEIMKQNPTCNDCTETLTN